MRHCYCLFFVPALAVIVLDQVSKYIIARAIPLYGSVTVINTFFNLVHVRNRGMAFGLLNRPDMGLLFYLMVAASICAVVLLIYWAVRLKNDDWKIVFGLSLILGGAIGNMIDRLRFKEVIDFLDFYIGSYHWPSFNLADSAITVGILWLALNIIMTQGARHKA
jgi:signal peptidase II